MRKEVTIISATALAFALIAQAAPAAEGENGVEQFKIFVQDIQRRIPFDK